MSIEMIPHLAWCGLFGVLTVAGMGLLRYGWIDIFQENDAGAGAQLLAAMGAFITAGSTAGWFMSVVSVFAPTWGIG